MNPYLLSWPGMLSVPVYIIHTETKTIYTEESPLPPKLNHLNDIDFKFVKASSVLKLLPPTFKPQARRFLLHINTNMGCAKKMYIQSSVSKVNGEVVTKNTTFLPLSTLLGFLILYPWCSAFQKTRHAVQEYLEHYLENQCMLCGYVNRYCVCSQLGQPDDDSLRVVGYCSEVSEKAVQTDDVTTAPPMMLPGKVGGMGNSTNGAFACAVLMPPGMRLPQGTRISLPPRCSAPSTDSLAPAVTSGSPAQTPVASVQPMVQDTSEEASTATVSPAATTSSTVSSDVATTTVSSAETAAGKMSTINAIEQAGNKPLNVGTIGNQPILVYTPPIGPRTVSVSTQTSTMQRHFSTQTPKCVNVARKKFFQRKRKQEFDQVMFFPDLGGEIKDNPDDQSLEASEDSAAKKQKTDEKGDYHLSNKADGERSVPQSPKESPKTTQNAQSGIIWRVIDEDSESESEADKSSDVTGDKLEKDLDGTPGGTEKDLDGTPGGTEKDGDVIPIPGRIEKDGDVTPGRTEKDLDVTPGRTEKDLDGTPGRTEKDLDGTPGRTEKVVEDATCKTTGISNKDESETGGTDLSAAVDEEVKTDKISDGELTNDNKTILQSVKESSQDLVGDQTEVNQPASIKETDKKDLDVKSKTSIASLPAETDAVNDQAINKSKSSESVKDRKVSTNDGNLSVVEKQEGNSSFDGVLEREKEAALTLSQLSGQLFGISDDVQPPSAKSISKSASLSGTTASESLSKVSRRNMETSPGSVDVEMKIDEGERTSNTAEGLNRTKDLNVSLESPVKDRESESASSEGEVIKKDEESDLSKSFLADLFKTPDSHGAKSSAADASDSCVKADGTNVFKTPDAIKSDDSFHKKDVVKVDDDGSESPCESSGEPAPEKDRRFYARFEHLPTGEKMYRCTYYGCGHCFDSKKAVVLHNSLHQSRENSTYLCCPDCTYKVLHRKWYEMLRHLKQKHAKVLTEATYGCDLCGLELESEEQLDGHSEYHYNGRYKCIKCGVVLATWKQVLLHKPDCPQKEKAEVNVGCPYCAFVFHIRHMRKIHILCHQDVGLTCPGCQDGVAWENWRSLRKHYVQQHGRTSKPEVVITKHPSCPRCELEFDKNSSFYHHMQKTHDWVPYTLLPCSRCEQTFRVQKTLTWHEKNAHGEEVPCDKCDYIGKSRTHLKIHQQKHVERQHMCTECGKMFLYYHQLRMHMAQHARKAFYSCKKCDMEFTRHADLRKHQQEHQRSRPSPQRSPQVRSCDLCDYTCNTASALQQHMKRTHPEDLSDEEDHCYFSKKDPPTPPPPPPKRKPPGRKRRRKTKRITMKKVEPSKRSTRTPKARPKPVEPPADRKELQRMKRVIKEREERVRKLRKVSCARTRSIDDQELMRSEGMTGASEFEQRWKDRTGKTENQDQLKFPGFPGKPVIEQTYPGHMIDHSYYRLEEPPSGSFTSPETAWGRLERSNLFSFSDGMNIVDTPDVSEFSECETSAGLIKKQSLSRPRQLQTVRIKAGRIQKMGMSPRQFQPITPGQASPKRVKSLLGLKSFKAGYNLASPDSDMHGWQEGAGNLDNLDVSQEDITETELLSITEELQKEQGLNILQDLLDSIQDESEVSSPQDSPTKHHPQDSPTKHQFHHATTSLGSTISIAHKPHRIGIGNRTYEVRPRPPVSTVTAPTDQVVEIQGTIPAVSRSTRPVSAPQDANFAETVLSNTTVTDLDDIELHEDDYRLWENARSLAQSMADNPARMEEGKSPGRAKSPRVIVLPTKETPRVIDLPVATATEKLWDGTSRSSQQVITDVEIITETDNNTTETGKGPVIITLPSLTSTVTATSSASKPSSSDHQYF